jgi:hypothetical protein
VLSIEKPVADEEGVDFVKLTKKGTDSFVAVVVEIRRKEKTVVDHRSGFFESGYKSDCILLLF